MDTSYLHEAFNESEEDRYVLILRVWHPELTAEETQAITFLFDCLDDSEIITNPDGQTMYDMMKVCTHAAGPCPLPPLSQASLRSSPSLF